MKRYIFLFLIITSISLNAQVVIYGSESGVSGEDYSAGNGFQPWTNTDQGSNSGYFVGNPSNNGMSSNNIGTNAFGLWATGDAYMNSYLQFDEAMQVGEKFTFYWTLNWDANNGSKGFEIQHSSYSSAQALINLNNTNSSKIYSNIDGNVTEAMLNYGTNPMLVTLTRDSSSQYSFSMTSRDGSEATYTTTISNSNAVDQIKIYIGNQNDGSGNRNIYFNHFKITSSSASASISNSRTLDNLEIENGATLTISPAGKVDVAGNLTNSGLLIINSDNDQFGSLIVQGTSSGNITYNRWINSISTGSPSSGDPGWDLVGSPVVGASLTSSDFSENSGNYAIQPYDNSDNTWTATSSATFNTSLGTGYAMAKATAGTEAFTGTVETLMTKT